MIMKKISNAQTAEDEALTCLCVTSATQPRTAMNYAKKETGTIIKNTAQQKLTKYLKGFFLKKTGRIKIIIVIMLNCFSHLRSKIENHMP